MNSWFFLFCVANEKLMVSEFPSTDVSLSPFVRPYNSTSYWPAGKVSARIVISPIGKKGKCCNERKKGGKKTRNETTVPKQTTANEVTRRPAVGQQNDSTYV